MGDQLFQCRHCRKLRLKRSPEQHYCGSGPCQRARKNSWRRSRLREDPDYRANQQAATQAWLESQGGSAAYYRRYRERQRASARCADQSGTGYTGSDSDHHLVVGVDWCDAYAYCSGVGKRLCGAIGGGCLGSLDFGQGGAHPGLLRRPSMEGALSDYWSNWGAGAKKAPKAIESGAHSPTGESFCLAFERPMHDLTNWGCSPLAPDSFRKAIAQLTGQFR